MRRRVLAAALLLSGLSAVGYASILWLMVPRHNITRESADAVHPGMARADVEAWLGGPAGNYSRDDAIPLHGAKLLPADYELWVGDQASVFVWFDEGGTVTRRVAAGVFRRRQSVFDTVLHWFRR